MKNDFDALMNKVEQGFINISDVTGINSTTTIKEVQASEKRLGGKIDALHKDTSQGLINLGDLVGIHAKTVIDEGKASEKNIIEKIDALKGAAFSALDWICVLIVTVLSGLCGWFFSKAMIAHEFAAWVDRKEVLNYVRDGAGNVVDITNTVTTETVWVTVILTIVLFAIVGMTLAYTAVSDLRSNEG